MPTDPNLPVPEPDFTAQQAAVAELTQKKQELMYELTSYHNMRNAEVPQVSKGRGGRGEGRGGWEGGRQGRARWGEGAKGRGRGAGAETEG